MAGSKMKEVAELLGVEMGVPFKIKDMDGDYISWNPYTFYDDGLHDRGNDKRCSVILRCLITGEYEIERTIPNNVEKRYLEGVLRPFKDRVIHIQKIQLDNLEYVYIRLKRFDSTGDDGIPLPYFEPNSMYKGMELNKNYTLEELGLFQD